MNEPDYLKFSKLAQSGISAEEFYLKLLDQGVSKLDIFALLRDERGLGLAEYTAIVKGIEKSTDQVE